MSAVLPSPAKPPTVTPTLPAVSEMPSVPDTASPPLPPPPPIDCAKMPFAFSPDVVMAEALFDVDGAAGAAVAAEAADRHRDVDVGLAAKTESAAEGEAAVAAAAADRLREDAVGAVIRA